MSNIEGIRHYRRDLLAIELKFCNIFSKSLPEWTQVSVFCSAPIPVYNYINICMITLVRLNVSFRRSRDWIVTTYLCYLVVYLL